MRKFTIIGLGLIGGSIAKTLKSKMTCEIIAIDPDLGGLQKALADGVIDRYDSKLTDVVAGSEIVFICTTVDLILPYLHRLPQYVGLDCIVTDVGSTKQNIMRHAAQTPELTFIGGHPMAGSEQAGYGAATDILFQNAYYILTPLATTLGSVVDKMLAMVQLLGGLPLLLDAAEHDQIVSTISHAPHVIAAALVNTAHSYSTRVKKDMLEKLAAGGFKDITRIASASPGMWSQISVENKDNILDFVRSFRQSLESFEKQLQAIERDSLYAYFENAKQYRDSFLLNGAINGVSVEHKILMDVTDQPGMIAAVATLLSQHHINIKNIGIVNNRELDGGVLHILLDSAEAVQKSTALLEAHFEGATLWT